MVGVRTGANRTVLLIGAWAIKVPSFRNGVTYFVTGMLANLLERDRWRLSHHPNLAPVYLSLPFGLLNVCKRYRHIPARLLTKVELAQLPLIGFDNNGHNAAWEGGRIVAIDYGNADTYLDLSGEQQPTTLTKEVGGGGE